jgi:hypothetical protein
MNKLTDNEVYAKFVPRVYGLLMANIKIYDLPPIQEEQFKNDFRSIVSRANDIIIRQLLQHQDWRASLTGAWLAFALDRKELTNEIGYFLIRGKAGTVGYCYALAKFGTEESSKIITSYLCKHLTFTKVPEERLQDRAIPALMYLDKINSTYYADEILKPGGPYDIFINTEFYRGLKLSQGERWSDIDGNYLHFCRTFDFVQSILP